MNEPPKRRLDFGEVTLVWGESGECKAELREEAVRRHMARPLGERLLAAIALVRRRSGPAPEATTERTDLRREPVR